MKQHPYVTKAGLGIIAFAATLLSVGCALNVKREGDMTQVKGRIGLEHATLLDVEASLPAQFDMDIGSDCGDWLVERAVEASTGGASILGGLVDFLFGWLK